MGEFLPAVFRDHRLEELLQGDAVQGIAMRGTFVGHGVQAAQRLRKTS